MSRKMLLKNSTLALALVGSLSVSAFADIETARERKKELLTVSDKKIELPAENLLLTIVEEYLIPGVHKTVYPYPKTPYPAMTDLEGSDSKYSLEVTMTPDAWSGMGLCFPAPIDLSEIRETAYIELDIKGKLGGEPLDIGFLDDGGYAGGRQVRSFAQSTKYGKITKEGFTTFKVPVEDMGKVGSFWDAALGVKIMAKFNWAAVSCFTLDNMKDSHPENKFWVDNVRLYSGDK